MASNSLSTSPAKTQDPILFSVKSDSGFYFKTSVLREGYHIGRSANFNANEIMNRSSPIYTYSNSNAMTLNIMLELFSLEGDTPTDVTDILKSFLSLVLPVDAGVKPPSLLTVQLGGLLTNWSCVLNSVDIHGGNYNQWSSDGHSNTAVVNLNFTGIEIENTSQADWLSTTDYSQLSFG